MNKNSCARQLLLVLGTSRIGNNSKHYAILGLMYLTKKYIYMKFSDTIKVCGFFFKFLLGHSFIFIFHTDLKVGSLNYFFSCSTCAKDSNKQCKEKT